MKLGFKGLLGSLRILKDPLQSHSEYRFKDSIANLIYVVGIQGIVRVVKDP